MFRMWPHLFAGAIALGLITIDAYAQSRRSPSYGTRQSYQGIPADVVPSHHAQPGGLPPAGDVVVPFAFGSEARTIDGTGNNVGNPTWGSAGTHFLRLAPVDYADGFAAPSGGSRPNARAISNALCAQTGSQMNDRFVTDMLWQWGQFLDHDIDLTEIHDPPEAFDIPVPVGDIWFDPTSTGTQMIPLDRSDYDPATGTGIGNPRMQMNGITSFIDASNVYGSDAVRASALRTNDGTGRLKTSAGNLLPFNTGGLPNAGGPSPSLFLAGDVRANEQVGLTVLHTLFMREHNRLAGVISTGDPGLTGEEVYQRARAIVGAQMQVITYKEFIPILLGSGSLTPYTGYDPSANPGVGNEFATASYRLGHTMLSSTLMRLGPDLNPIAEGNLPLRDAYFTPTRITNEGGIDPVLRGLSTQMMQEVDMLIVDDVRNFLFGSPGAGGFDLAALNIQRGRDHGLASYNATRVAYGLSPVGSFAEITNSSTHQAELQATYGDVNDMDLWVVSLAEDDLPGSMVGPTLMAVLKDQFERLRDGDRFWYQNVFVGAQLVQLQGTRLSDVIRRNTDIDGEIQGNVFIAPNVSPIPAVSTWGLLALCILLLIAAKLAYRGQPCTAVTALRR